jgi:hypothetical protein
MTKSITYVAAVLFYIISSFAMGGTLEERFITPPFESRPWCYWYWMNGNITRDGIRADMQAFADVGVGGVLTFDIGIHPAGPVTNRSPEWYELIKFAACEAERHGIKMGFHCPGWSASGGPWISPEQGMQELTWSETMVEGPRELDIKLPQPPTRLGCYRDAAVIAFPSLPGDRPLPAPRFMDVEGKALPAGVAALDTDTTTTADLPAEFDLVFPEAVEVCSAFARVARASGSYNATLSAWDETKGTFKVVAKFRSHTSGPFSANIGSASFAAVKSSKFRFDFGARKRGERIYIEKLEMGGGFRITDWTCKAGFATDRIMPRPGDAKPQAEDVIALDRIVDLGGKSKWSVPAGRWTILRIGYTPTGVHIAPAPMGGDGLECDKLSREVADFHYDKCVTPVLRDFGRKLTKQAVAYYHVDSYEAGWQNWSEKLPREFKDRRGYDLKKYLPAVTGRVVGDIATTEKFLWDFRRTIGDLYADNHYGRLAERCHKDGIQFSVEPYGGPFEFMQVGNRADHPMVEFWLPTRPQGRKVAFPGVFAGHTTGRTIIGAEAFTSGPPEEKWNSHPYSLKALGDYIYCCGVNRFVIHVSAHQPLVGEHTKPGFTCGCNGIHFDRNNTWWQHGAKEWSEYLTRCQSLLQAGEHVADVIYFQGNDSPDGIGPYDPPLPEGYDFDVCNSETLETLAVKRGRLVLPGGKSYAYLVMPKDGSVTIDSLKKVLSLAKKGARVVGTVPVESPSLAEAGERDDFGRLAKELAGRIVSGKSFNQILAADKLVPDFSFDQESGLILKAIHRRVGDADVYFVASASPNAGTADCRFRVSGKVPELWRPDAGSMEMCAVYEQAGDVVRIPLKFDPAGSVFVVFRKGRGQPHAVDVLFAGKPSGSAVPAVVIKKASYGLAGDAQKTLDVTSQLAARVKDGQLKMSGFEQLAGDPAPGIVKQLKVDYAVDGKPGSIELKDGDVLRLPEPGSDKPDCRVASDGKSLEVIALKAGRYAVALPGGQTQVVEVASVPASQVLDGPWTVEFPQGWGAPDRITLDKLVSWPDHSDAGVKYFSGTGTYRTRFTAALFTNHVSRIFLDFGRVEVIAEVWLNGKPLGTLWKPPFRVDITDAIKDGTNELEVRVTNLWPNRLIGDEQFADDLAVGYTWKGGGIHAWPEWLLKNQPRPEPRRKTFFTWKHWNNDDDLLPSGLLGPVQLLTSRSVVVKDY